MFSSTTERVAVVAADENETEERIPRPMNNTVIIVERVFMMNANSKWFSDFMFFCGCEING